MNFNLLRPVIFANLKVGEVLQAYSGLLPTEFKHLACGD